MRPSWRALGTSMLMPFTSPAANTCGRLLRRSAPTLTYPRAVATPTASAPSASALPASRRRRTPPQPRTGPARCRSDIARRRQLGAVEPFDQRRGQHGNTAAAEGIGQRGGDVLVRMRDKPGRRLYQNDLGTEVGQDGGELATGIRATDHRDRRWQRGEAAKVLIGQRKLGAGNRQPTGMPADRNDDGVPAEGAPVGDSHRVRVDEPGRSGTLDQVD